MHHEYERNRAAAPATTTTDNHTFEPGQSSRSALLRKPEHVTASGIVQRKKCDASGLDKHTGQLPDDAASKIYHFERRSRKPLGAGDRDAARGAIDATLAAADTSSGRPVPEHIQARFGAAGADISEVRLHVSEPSARAAESVGARAYTIGQDVHFGASQYAPGSRAGDFLIAHEVAHTIQQATGPSGPQFGLEVSQTDDPAEVEADQAAHAVLSDTPMLPTLVSRGAQRKIMRWTDPASAQAVVQAIGDATVDQLRTIRIALGDAEGSADDLVGIEVPGWAGYVARTDLPDLIALVQHRIVATAPTSSGPEASASRADASTDASEPMFSAGSPASSNCGPDASTDGPAASDRQTTWRLPGAGPLVSARDADIRITEYVQPAEELSRRVMADVAAGRITHMEGRENAFNGRDGLRSATRERLSPGGRGMSEAVEPRGDTLAELVDKYALRMLEENPELRARFGIETVASGDAATERALAAIRDSPEVSRAIIDAAGRPNAGITRAARVMRVAGPVLVGAQIVVGGYRVLAADEGEHMWTAGQEISGFAGGTVGSTVGGMVVSALGAVVVAAGITVSAPVVIVVSLVVVGGMAMAGSWAGESIWNHTVDHGSMRAWEIEFSRAMKAFLRASTGDRIAAALPMYGLAAGGGFSGLMNRDWRRFEEERRRAPPIESTRDSGGESP